VRQLKLELDAVRKELRLEIQKRTCLERALTSERKTNENLRRALEGSEDEDRKCANLYVVRPVKLVCLTMLCRQIIAVCAQIARERVRR